MPTKRDEDKTKGGRVKKSPLEDDLTAFRNFKELWESGALPEDDPVVAKTSYWARRLSLRYKCPERADDLRQEALLRLARADYEGKKPLDGYIRATIDNLYSDEQQKEGGKRRGKFPADIRDEASPDLFEEVSRAEEEDRLVADLISGSWRRDITVRRLAEIASQTLGRKVSQRAVVSVLKELQREVLNRHQHYRQTAAKRRVTELRGLGKELWRGRDAQEYVNSERESWHN